MFQSARFQKEERSASCLVYAIDGVRRTDLTRPGSTAELVRYLFSV